MKLSVSLPDDDVEFIDLYAEDQGVESRSAVLHHALRLLRATELADSYEAAWNEWSTSGESGLWEATTGDGVTAAAR